MRVVLSLQKIAVDPVDVGILEFGRGNNDTAQATLQQGEFAYALKAITIEIYIDV